MIRTPQRWRRLDPDTGRYRRLSRNQNTGAGCGRACAVLGSVLVVVVAAGVPDPTVLYRVRDGAYAADLLIAAVVKFDLFTWLTAHGPVTSSDLRAGLGLAERPADVLLTYCAALGLVDRDLAAHDRVSVTELGRHHLVAGSSFDLRAYYKSLAERPAVGELAAVLRTDDQAAWASAKPGDDGVEPDWSSRLEDEAFAQRITAAMDARGAFLAPALAAAVVDVPVTALLDVGGSSGIYAAAVIAGRPSVRAAVFERPPVDAAARTLLDARGLSDRVDVVTGDMFTDPLPRGFDVHLYSQVLHDWDAQRVEQLLAASFAALPPGGVLVDHDAHVAADKRGPLPVAEYSVLLMHSTPGKCWSVAELTAMAGCVGFVDVEHRTAAGDRGVLLARKPG
ncbi:methyltransferase [Pseudonocardia charpentierae]|uniref:methyltransferase n=1 Tax=Pseudonocardia charpentierae TaxID=3075545 RepID=UPI0037CC0272